MQEFGILGKSKQIKDLIDIAVQVSQSDISVLIYGESGVGKDLFANMIHRSSKRADNKLISVNCGAIPEGILESELFGHKKGAFTGAIDDRKGYFELADNGMADGHTGDSNNTSKVKRMNGKKSGERQNAG